MATHGRLRVHPVHVVDGFRNERSAVEGGESVSSVRGHLRFSARNGAILSVHDEPPAGQLRAVGNEARDRNEVGAATAPRCSRTHGPAGDDLVLYVITADGP